MSKKKDFLNNYMNATSPTGYETAGQKIWLDYISEFVDNTYTDTYGNAVGVIEGFPIGSSQKIYNVMIEAHADEIGWTVSHIDSSGFLSVVRLGGSDHHIAPGMKVQILGDKGLVKGHFGWLAIHERKGAQAKLTPEVNNLFIDIGAKSKQEVEDMGVFVGTPLVYDTTFEERNGEYISRALDNRIGGYMIAQVVKKLNDNNIELPFNLHIVNAVQEEIGLRGAEMIANSIKPDIAIVTDVCHDTHTPLMNQKLAGDVKSGLGPVIYKGADIQLNLNKLVLKVANDNDIKFQRGAYNGNSGTDTGVIYRANGGVASQLISLPLKYMHTTVETVNKKDVKSVINLIYKTLLNIDVNDNLKYIK